MNCRLLQNSFSCHATVFLTIKMQLFRIFYKTFELEIVLQKL